MVKCEPGNAKLVYWLALITLGIGPLEHKMLIIPTEPVYLLVFLMRDIVSVGISKIENYKLFDCWNATQLKNHFLPIRISATLTKSDWT